MAVNYYAESEILFKVGRDSFMPPPNVDSAVIRLTLRQEPEIALNDEKKFFRFVKACFAQRRKTLINTVSSGLGIPKDTLRQALEELGLDATARSEALTMEELAGIANRLFPVEDK